MDAIRRGMVTAIGAGLALALGGCASSQHPEVRYKETFTSVLISTDDKHLVAVGTNHHYVFDAPPTLVAALHSELHARLRAEFSTFHVDPQATITGDYALLIAGDLPPDAQEAAAGLGFARDDAGTWRETGHLQGRRYSGWTYRMGEQQQRLSQPYTVDIVVEAHHGDAVVQSLDTPIRVAADGVQLIYYAPLAPIIIPVIFMTAAKDH
jgi:hypothetical protein